MVDFAAIEKKWQDLWEKEGVFQASVKKNKKKFFLTVPYPYTSGPLHIGHGRSYTIGDILARYYRMLGYNVLFPMAAHVSGTPVASISKRIEEGDKKTIQLYREYVSLYEKDPEKVKEILESFKEPENVANFFAERIKNDLKLLGCSIDWRRFFRTNERYYNRFVEWQFKKLNSKGLLKQGSYPILYCLSCENAVGEDDIKGGDEIKASVMELQLIKFELEEEEGTYLVASTLRAETIFGVTNLWVNPKDELVKIQIESEKWLVSEASLTKLEKQGRDFKVLEKVQARGLIGKYVKSPIEGRKLLILPADFVDPDFGTGVVYSVPSHAPYDWVALREFRENKIYEEYGIPEDEVLDIAPISLIRVPNFGEHPAIEICEKMGVRSQKETEKLEEATQTLYREEYYNGVLKEICGQFAGMKVAEAKEEVFKFLEQRGLATKMYEVSALEKPVRCRCGGKVIVAVLKDQWFLDYKRKEWKELARRC
ncbi:arginine--tRNA ligase, partial [Nanoarchaeota archaeon]